MIATTGLMTRDRLFVAVAPRLSEALTVNVEFAGVVGVPVMAPVALLIDRPAGNKPAVTAKVIVPEPPVVATVVL